MQLLAIETTGPFASAALIDDAGRVSEIASDEKLKHLQGLSAMIAELLKGRGLQARDLDCVAASQGPGSFTGIRIGVSAARALAQAAGISAMGVPTLASFVYHLPSYGGVVCPVFDARRGQVYSGAFYLGADGGPVALLAGAARTPAELRAALEGIARDGCEGGPARELRFFGDGIGVCGDMFAELRAAPAAAQNKTPAAALEIGFAPWEARFQKASSAARLALHMLRHPASEAGAPGAPGSYNKLLPVYMRKAEAERRRDEALASRCLPEQSGSDADTI
jgi:tRNA threonylcarbamoyladenosine biosynthesis protein TsaB